MKTNKSLKLGQDLQAIAVSLQFIGVNAMKRAIATALFAAVSGYAGAQNVSYEAMRLADLITESTWEATAQTIPLILAGAENQLRTASISEKAAKIFVAELRKTANRENITKALALTLSAKFSAQEAKDLAVFMQSELGRKYLDMSKDLATTSAYFMPIVKQACVSTVQQLSDSERQTTARICDRL